MLAFAPDAPLTTPDILVAVSAIPTARGYASPPQGVNAGASSVGATTTGGALLPKLDGSSLTLVGSAADVYSLSAGSWSSIGTGYSAGVNRWAFAIFGNTILAANKAVELQSGTTTLSTISNAPKASTIETCQGFVILGDCDDSSTGLSTGFGDQPHRWWISQFENPTGDWTPNASNQCTSGLLVETPGAIVRVCRLNSEVVVYKARSLYLGRFDGSDAVLRFTAVAADVGCPARDAVVSAGSAHYFPGDDNFWMFDGSRPVPIGEAIREWFFGSDITPGALNRQQQSLMQALHDRRSGLIYWFYPGSGQSTLTGCICYHYKTGRWGSFAIAINDAIQAVASAITIDGLDALYATIADIPEIPFDSPYWTAATPVLSYINSSNVLFSLSGSGGPMSLTTGLLGGEEAVSLCESVRPLFRTTPSSATITGYTRAAAGDAATLAATSTLANGRFPLLQSGRYHQFAVVFADQTELEMLPPKLIVEGEE